MITHHKTVFLFSLYINAYEVEHLAKTTQIIIVMMPWEEINDDDDQ